MANGQKIKDINLLQLSIINTNPLELKIEVTGHTIGKGWTAPRLVECGFREEDAGIFEFDYTAYPPKKETFVDSPIFVEHKFIVPAGLKAICVNSENNYVEKKLWFPPNVSIATTSPQTELEVTPSEPIITETIIVDVTKGDPEWDSIEEEVDVVDVPQEGVDPEPIVSVPLENSEAINTTTQPIEETTDSTEKPLFPGISEELLPEPTEKEACVETEEQPNEVPSEEGEVENTTSSILVEDQPEIAPEIAESDAEAVPTSTEDPCVYPLTVPIIGVELKNTYISYIMLNRGGTSHKTMKVFVEPHESVVGAKVLTLKRLESEYIAYDEAKQTLLPFYFDKLELPADGLFFIGNPLIRPAAQVKKKDVSVS